MHKFYDFHVSTLSLGFLKSITDYITVVSVIRRKYKKLNKDRIFIELKKRQNCDILNDDLETFLSSCMIYTKADFNSFDVSYVTPSS